jgi:CBS domain-containing protein
MGFAMYLYDVEPFKHLDREVVDKVIEMSRTVKYESGTEVFNQSDKPTGFLYFVKKGLVEIIAETPEGVEMVVDYRKDGAFFGWTPIFTNEGYTAGARCSVDTECLLIPREKLQEIAKQYPIVSKHFSKAIFSQIRNLYQDMIGSHNDPMSQTEAYPFQKRLSEIMSSPVKTCTVQATVKEVAQKMTKEGISAVLVVDDTGKMVGIVTERDLVRKVLARDTEDCLKNSTAADIMTPDPYHMSADTFMYEAATFVVVHKIRHLPVMDGDRIAGIVTLQDLMRFRSQKSMLLVGNAKEATTISELKDIRRELVKVARVLLFESRSHVETMEILSYIHHTIIRRCYEIVLEEYISEGNIQPDIKYCFMLMGSGGRKEMLLNPDQDNGFIYEDYPDEIHQQVEDFFNPLAERLVLALEEVGYPLCNGKVMVNNPMWRGRLKEWKERVAKWIRVPEPQKVRYSTIFFDFMPVVGEGYLCSDLRDIVFDEIKKNPIFLYTMMELDFKHKVPIGILGGFITHSEHKGKLSLKENGSIFIVDCSRIFMLERGIHVESTSDRLDKLLELRIFNRATIEHVKAAFESFTFLRLRNEINLIDQGLEPSHFIDPETLPKEEKELLKEAFKVASKLQDSTKRYFSKIIGR